MVDVFQRQQEAELTCQARSGPISSSLESETGLELAVRNYGGTVLLVEPSGENSLTSAFGAHRYLLRLSFLY